MQKKYNNLLIATGWHSDGTGHRSKWNRSKQCTEPDWLMGIWLHYIERYIKPAKYHVYISNCSVLPNIVGDKFEYNFGHVKSELLDPRHDFQCSVLMGAMYAYLNGFDFCYVEQDCLIYHIDKALEFAKDHKICFGFGDGISLNRGWAEQCFMWVRNDYLPTFIERGCHQRIHESNGLPVPEVQWMALYGTDFTAWPVGYGRKRPADFWKWAPDKLDWWFLQQITDDDINKFLWLK